MVRRPARQPATGEPGPPGRQITSGWAGRRAGVCDVCPTGTLSGPSALQGSHGPTNTMSFMCVFTNTNCLSQVPFMGSMALQTQCLSCVSSQTQVVWGQSPLRESMALQKHNVSDECQHRHTLSGPSALQGFYGPTNTMSFMCVFTNTNCLGQVPFKGSMAPHNKMSLMCVSPLPSALSPLPPRSQTGLVDPSYKIRARGSRSRDPDSWIPLTLRVRVSRSHTGSVNR